jgi:hypothetical protein
MENRIKKKIDSHLSEFKNDIKEWFNKNDSTISGPCTQNDFLEFIFDYSNMSLSKEDFQKRKRIKNTIPNQIRCCAKRANGEQCTRRKKNDHDFCGTHCKGTPYGVVKENKSNETIFKQKKIWVEDIKGIQYFIDETGNVYDHEEVLSNKVNPKILTQYTKDTLTNSYQIPEYGI